MQQCMTELSIRTPGRSMIDVSAQIDAWLTGSGTGNGLLTAFVRHTSASLTIQENADPDVQADLLDAFDQLAPETAPYRHGAEGPDDMPAHIKSALTSTSLTIPVSAGRMTLGTWQGVYLIEHRARPHQRQIVLHFMGELRQ